MRQLFVSWLDTHNLPWHAYSWSRGQRAKASNIARMLRGGPSEPHRTVRPVCGRLDVGRYK